MYNALRESCKLLLEFAFNFLFSDCREFRSIAVPGGLVVVGAPVVFSFSVFYSRFGDHFPSVIARS